MKCLFTWEFGEGVGSLLLQEGHHHIRVDLEREDRQESRQRDVGHDADQAVVADRDQGDEDRAEDHARVDRVHPEVGVLEAHDVLHHEKEELISPELNMVLRRFHEFFCQC